MKKRYSIPLLLGIVLVCAIVFSDLIVLKLFGVQEIESFSKEEYDSSVSKIKEIIGGNAAYLVSSEKQFEAYHTLVTKEKQYVLTKPIQILYFEDDALVSFQSSCNVPVNYWTWKYDWNFENRFEQCPPKTSDATIAIPLQKLKAIYPSLESNNNQNTIIVFWTRVLEKQVLEVVGVLKKQRLSFPDNFVNQHLVFINTDHSFKRKVSFDEE